MYYVLRTHGQVKAHWGITTIGIFKTKKLAEAFCKVTIKSGDFNMKLIIVKSKKIFEVTGIEYKESTII